MSEFLRELAALLVSVFVVTSLLNVGLTQHPRRIRHHLGNRGYLVRMLVINLLVVPSVMVLAVQVVGVDPIHATGLVLFGMCAGAPFAIKLTATSRSDIALGATVLMVLMMATVVVLPILLPRVIDAFTVDPFAIAWSLLRQMVLPMVVGMALHMWAPGLAGFIQPWVARISNIALYALLAATLLGYADAMADPELWKAIATGGVVILVAFGLGYMTGDGRHQLKTVGGLSTAQRGTAAAMIVASQNVDDARVFVVVNVLNTLGIVVLLGFARYLGKGNRLVLLDSVVADAPAPAKPPRPRWTTAGPED